MAQRGTRYKPPTDSVWVDCYFYGFYLKKDQVHLWQVSHNLRPLDMTPKTFEVVNKHMMKRADTTRQYLDKEQIPVSAILQVVDSDDKDSEHFVDKKRRHDDLRSAIINYAISTGVSGVQYFMDTLFVVLNN